MFRSFQTLKIDSNKEKVLENGDTHGERKYFNFEDHVYGTRISRYNRSSFRASRYRDDPLEGCPVNGAHPLSEIRSLSRKKIVITPRRIPSKRLLASIWKSNKSLAAFEKEEGEGEEAIAPSHWLTLYSVARAPLKRNSILAIRQSSPSSIFRQVSFGLDWSIATCLCLYFWISVEEIVSLGRNLSSPWRNLKRKNLSERVIASEYLFVAETCSVFLNCLGISELYLIFITSRVGLNFVFFPSHFFPFFPSLFFGFLRRENELKVQTILDGGATAFYLQISGFSSFLPPSLSWQQILLQLLLVLRPSLLRGLMGRRSCRCA